jgi:hypothetical protein
MPRLVTDLIEKIGPIVGVVAFLGLAILAFLIFQQAREVRRLREWAGRAPERAAEAADATAAAAEARGEAVPAEPDEEEPEPAIARPPGRVSQWWAGVRERLAPAWADLDRRSPVDPRYFLIVIAAAIVAVGVVTGGFGLIGGDDEGGGGGGGGGGSKPDKEEKLDVAVLNATQEVDVNGEVIPGVSGLADDVARQVVKPNGFAIGEKTNATEGFDDSTIFFEPGSEDAAEELAQAVAPDLGETEVEPMISDVEELAGGAPIVLLVGRDDADVLGSAG